MKPYYEHAGITIYHGDCREIGNAAAARVVSDPPYGCGHYKSDRDVEMSVLLAAYVRDYETVAIFGYPELLVRWCVEAKAYPSEWITWWPTNKITARNRGLNQEAEHIGVFGEVVGASLLTRPRSLDGTRIRRAVGRRAATHVDAKWGDVWRMAAPGCGYNHAQRLHPNEKPEELLAALIVLCSRERDCIFDPFMGSGTTLVAAKRIGRKAIGIEIEEKYCEIAAKRLAQEALPLDLGA